MRRFVAVSLAAALVAAATASAADAACSYRARLSASTHRPKAGKPWAVTVTTSTRRRTAAHYEFLFGGQVVSRQYPFYKRDFTFRRRFRDATIVWPARSIGYPLTFRVVLRNGCGTRRLDLRVRVRR